MIPDRISQVYKLISPMKWPYHAVSAEEIIGIFAREDRVAAVPVPAAILEINVQAETGLVLIWAHKGITWVLGVDKNAISSSAIPDLTVNKCIKWIYVESQRTQTRRPGMASCNHPKAST
jgi:hypothetical protein